MIVANNFYSKVLLYFAAATLIVIACSLGRWQLQRAQAKEEQMALITSYATRSITTIETLNYRDKVLFHHLRVCGHWLPEATVYLDNRPNQFGQAGVEVLTPLQINEIKSDDLSCHQLDPIERDTPKLKAAASSKFNEKRVSPTQSKQRFLLVKRGWLPRHPSDRNQLLPFITPTAVVQVEGLILPDVSRVYSIGTEASLKESRLRQNLQLSEFAQAFSLDLYPFILQQEILSSSRVELSDGLQRRWGKIDQRIERHYGYAFQWFSLAALMLALCLYFTYKSYRNRSLKKPLP